MNPPTAASGESRPAADEELRIPIQSDLDIVAARRGGRGLASQLAFSPSELTLIATAISELARNIVVYAKQGEIRLQLTERNGRRGIVVTAIDQGPGIRDVRLALQDGYSTSQGLGLGLPGVRRLMDEFAIDSEKGKGTRVVTRKWESNSR